MNEIDAIIKFFSHSPDRGKDKIMIDVGAHIGSSSLPFARQGWRIYCFEPEPNNYAELFENMKNFPKITCIQMAVSNIDQEDTSFYVSQEHWGIHSLRPFHPSHKQTMSVKTIRLDTVLGSEKIPFLDFLKIDVEGADFLVLQGMDWNNYCPSMILVEFMDSRTVKNFGYSFHDMVEYMKQHGYDCIVFEYDKICEYGRKGVKTKESKLIDIYDYNKNTNPDWGNLIFFQEDDRTYLQKAIKRALWKKRLKILRR